MTVYKKLARIVAQRFESRRFSQWVDVNRTIARIFVGTILGSSLVAGCIDGPMYALKRANPYFQNEWKKDREQGPIFTERVEEMRSLRGQIASMDSDELNRWSTVVSDVYLYDTSPEMRREAVLTLAKAPTDIAEQTLVKACTDKVVKVRIAACKTLADRRSADASKMLVTVAQTDKNSSVRLAAMNSLGNHKTPESIATLRKALDDKSPAMQYEATVALKKMTGSDFEGNVDRWKQFVDSGEINQANENIRQATLPERLLETLPLRR